MQVFLVSVQLIVNVAPPNAVSLISRAPDFFHHRPQTVPKYNLNRPKVNMYSPPKKTQMESICIQSELREDH